MITILTTLLGFIGPFLPEVLKYLNRAQDNAHELAMMKLQAELAEKQHGWRMEEVNVQADIAESLAIRAPQQSFGVQLLDAAKGWPSWVIVPVFWAFALLDWLNGTVRPMVTYWIVGFWLVYKYAVFTMLEAASGSFGQAVINSWGEYDYAVLNLCLGYFFGQRAAKAAFGGNASTGRAGGG